MLIRIDGELGEGVTSKDIILHIIGIIGTAGGTGYTIEFAGTAIEALSMEARMSISNMAIEAGARAGIIAPDEVTYEYLKGRPMCPKGDEWDKAVEYWNSLKTDKDAEFDKTVIIDAKDIVPTITWGTSPQDVAPVTGNVPVADPSVSPARAVSIAAKKLYLILGKLSNSSLVYDFPGWYQARIGVHWFGTGTKAVGRSSPEGLYRILHEWTY